MANLKTKYHLLIEKDKALCIMDILKKYVEMGFIQVIEGKKHISIYSDYPNIIRLIEIKLMPDYD